MNLNDNDNKLLMFCTGRPKSIREIAEHLGIAVKNVAVRLPRLEKEKLIIIKKDGLLKKTFVKRREDSKVKEYHIEILNQLKKEGGEMEMKKFHSLLPYNPFNEKDYDKRNATLQIEYSGMVDKIIKLNEKGKKFLKENESK